MPKKKKKIAAEPVVLPDAKPKPEVDEDAWGNDGLTHKQRLFVRFYVGEAAGNATKAAQLAGYRDDNRNSLGVTAHDTLRKPNVQRALSKEMGKRFGSEEDIINGIAAIANGNAADYLATNADGELVVDLNRLADAGALGLIHEIKDKVLKVGEGQVSVIERKFKLYDKLKALELMARIKGLVVDRHRHEGEVKFSPITFDGEKEAKTE